MNNNATLYRKCKFYFNGINTHKYNQVFTNTVILRILLIHLLQLNTKKRKLCEAHSNLKIFVLCSDHMQYINYTKYTHRLIP